MKTSDLALPECWPHLVRKAMIQVCSLAHWAIIYTRSMAADSKLQRVQLAVKLDTAKNEISLLQEELRIIKTRFVKMPVKHRPYYPPFERMAILELKAIRGWNLKQSAAHFIVDKETISSWLKRIEDNSLVRIPVPVNKFPEVVRYVVRRLKILCPKMGKKQIAEFLARAGLFLSATTVGRFLKAQTFPPQDNLKLLEQAQENVPPHVVTAKYPNHVWHIDLTTVSTCKGFWTSWFPWALPQIWPFCYWIAIILDHFSRTVVGFALFKKQPSLKQITDALKKAIRRNSKPKYIISDKGKQFWCTHYKTWCKRKKIKPRYGAVGKHGSIAVIERFIRSMKDECTRQILVPLNFGDFRKELALYVVWYNFFRPHQALDGNTPTDVYDANDPPATPKIPNSHLPEMRLHVSFLEGRMHLPVVKLNKAA